MSVHLLAHHRLMDLYPDIDPLFVSEALSSYPSAKYRIKDYPITEVIVYVDDLVTVFRRKVQDMNGVYPTVLKGDRVRTANRDLEAVSLAFPFVPQQTLLELVQNPPPGTSLSHSLLYSLPQNLLDNPHLYVPSNIPQSQPLAPAYRLRTTSYKKHVEALLSQNHPMLSKSQIRAVGLEVNWDFAAVNTACEEIVKQLGWAGRMLGGLRAFTRSKLRVEIEQCPELQEELGQAEKRLRAVAAMADEEVAKDYNRQQYLQDGQTIECVCCFEDSAFEDGAACSSGCFVCQACIKAQVMSLLPTLPTPDDSINPASTLIPCPAALPPCPNSYIPDTALQSHLSTPTYTLYLKSFLTAHLRPITNNNPEISQCPTCPYFEIRPLPQLSPFWNAIFISFLWLTSWFIDRKPRRHLVDLLRKVEISRSTSLLRCPACKTTSCRLCEATVYGLHRCGATAVHPADEAQELRITLETAMAESLKRVCPHCEVAFIKDDGCNHMTCACGGHMCYVCRADIKKDGYRHFCQHLRQVAGGSCPERCGKCELFRNESDDVVAKAAAKKARVGYLTRKVASGQAREVTLEGWMNDALLLSLGRATKF